MPNDYENEKLLVKEEFERILNRLILDPTFRFEVENVDVINRLSMTGDHEEKVFIINVKTNNRGQLLGQIYPFNPGGYRGYFNNFFSGMIVQKLENVFNPEYYFFIEVNAIPFSKGNIEKIDCHLSLKEAIEHGIVPEHSPLTQKMNQYNLTHLILAGGTLITGPLADSIETMEKICTDYEIKSVLDVCCGSGALTKVILSCGATAATCVDLNLTTARKNLMEVSSKIKFHEMDLFNYIPDNRYDLIIGDPYYDIADDFIDKSLPILAPACKYFFMTVGFIDTAYWNNRLINKIKKHFSQVRFYNTGRMVQVLCTNE